MWTNKAKVTFACVTDTQTDTSGAIRDFAAQNDRPGYFRPVTSDLTLKWHGASRWDMTQQAATVDKNIHVYVCLHYWQLIPNRQVRCLVILQAAGIKKVDSGEV